MDLRAFYQRIRQVESEIREPFVQVVSKATPDGGKAGVKTDVSRRVAARLLVEGKAELHGAADGRKSER
jgi:hypothetical protein